MNDLENRLNTKLLNRTTGLMSPTEAGQRLYERIAPMFGGIQGELAALGNLGDTERGRLCINTAGKPCVLSDLLQSAVVFGGVFQGGRRDFD